MPPSNSTPQAKRVGRLVDSQGNALLISRTPAAIGRKNADVFVDEPAVSSRHALIDLNADGFFVRDTGSTNGTFVNDVRVEQAPLKNGDRLRFAGAAFSFYESNEPVVLRKTDTPKSPGLAGEAKARFTLHALQDGTELAIVLDRESVSVGRVDCDINLADQTLSRRHFCIDLGPETITLRDLGSANGTQVRGEKVKSTALQPGETFQAGRTIFHIEALT